MKKRLWIVVVAAFFAAGCSLWDADETEKTNVGLFAAYDAPVFSPPRAGEMRGAEVIAAAMHDVGVNTVAMAPYSGTELAAIRPFAGIKGCSAVRHADVKTCFALAAADGLLGRRAIAVFDQTAFAEIVGDLALCAGWKVNSGVVVLVFSDVAGRYSASRINVEKIATAADLPVRIAQPEKLYNEIFDAFMTSEHYQVPFVLIVDSDYLNAPLKYGRISMSGVGTYEKDLTADVMSPALANYRMLVHDAKKAGGDPAELVQTPDLPTIPDSLPGYCLRAFELYRPTMTAVAEAHDSFSLVASEGDALGYFAFAPFYAVDAAGFPGSAIPLAVRASQRTGAPGLAVMNEHDFMRFGASGVSAVRAEGTDAKILVINTMQPEFGGFSFAVQEEFERLLAAVAGEVAVTRVNYDTESDVFVKLLKEKAASGKPEIIVVDYRDTETAVK